MKKSLFLLLALLLVGMLILSLSACEDVPDGAQDSSTQGDGEQDGDTQGTGTQGGDTQSEGEHKHAFNKKSTASKYLKSEATCEAKAVYYYSCECGDKGTQAFESGELLAHEYTVKNTDSKYLKATATEDTAAIYYYSCECGKKGSTTFTDGTALESDHAHVYDQKSATKEYLKSKATCQKKALYYYSCECGRKGSATFESGTLAQHIYTASVKSASCSTDGYTEHVCACGDSYKDSYTSAKGHDFQECRKMTLGTNHNATVCTRCQLEVVAYGNADGTWTTQPKSVMYYVTGEPFICSSGGLDYTNHHIVIYGSGAMPDFSDPEQVPWALYLGDAKKITIEEGITTIGTNAFHAPRPQFAPTFEMADSVKTIKANSINLSMTSFTVGKGVERIEGTISGPNLRNLYLPKSLKYLGGFGSTWDLSVTIFYEGTREEFLKISTKQYNRTVTIRDVFNGWYTEYVPSVFCHVYVNCSGVLDHHDYYDTYSEFKKS